MSKKSDFITKFLFKFKHDKVFLLGSSQAFYYLLSLFPIIVIGLAIIPYLNIDPTGAVDFLKETLPGDMASVFEKEILNLINNPRGWLLVFGIIGALWSTSNAVHALITSINEAYDIKETRSLIFMRAIALVFAAGMIIAFIITMIFPVFGHLMLDFLKNFFDIDIALSGLLQVLRWVFALLFIIVFLSLLYRFAPNLKLPLTHVLPGAITVSILWQILTFGLYIYVSNFGAFSAIYGSLGVLIIIMIWFFLTGIILMIGAIINALYHDYKQRS